jgi:UDP-2,3-diacylglucosamine pyrophosphatase LpxH
MIIITISDTHIGGIRFANRTRQFYLHQIFSELETNPNLHTLILNGDFLETWLDPFDVDPPKIENILVNTNVHGSNIFQYMQQLDNIARKKEVQVLILKGNHDISINQEHVDKAGWKNVKVSQEDIFYFGNLVVQHGHQFDIWNSPDPVKGILPFGHIVSRTEGEKSKSKSISEIIESDEKAGWNPAVKWLCTNILATRAGIWLFKDDISWINPRVIGQLLGGTFWDNIYKGKYSKESCINIQDTIILSKNFIV